MRADRGWPFCAARSTKLARDRIDVRLVETGSATEAHAGRSIGLITRRSNSRVVRCAPAGLCVEKGCCPPETGARSAEFQVLTVESCRFNEENSGGSRILRWFSSYRRSVRCRPVKPCHWQRVGGIWHDRLGALGGIHDSTRSTGRSPTERRIRAGMRNKATPIDLTCLVL